MMHCRFCKSALSYTFADLGVSPLSNAYLSVEDLAAVEPFFPLHARVCSNCFLVQLPELETPENIFSEYPYFSSYSDSWKAHCKSYADMICELYHIDSHSHVVEIGSNDGCMLQYFKNKRIPVLGIEPAVNVAMVANSQGIDTLNRFFNTKTAMALAMESKHADLLLGNNVLAHVPDLNDFVMAMKILLKPAGIITMEFPHLMKLMEQNQFDTIYHEHFSYFSLLTVEKIFEKQGLNIFDVEQLPTHGGSLRIYARHCEYTKLPVSDRLNRLRTIEQKAGYDNINHYVSFDARIKGVKRDILSSLIHVKEAGRSVAAYGAPAKGNTLLNYCGIGPDLIDYTVDRNPHKQGRYLPGTHIPIYHPNKVTETKPDVLFILPWNLKEEIMEQMAAVRDWGGVFMVPIPEVRVYD
jgi:SAM-dependent methyltransferase